MKKSILVVLMAVFCLGTFAQSSWRNNRSNSGHSNYDNRGHRGSSWHNSDFGRPYYIGLRFGGALSTLNSDNKWYDSSSKSGLELGAVVGMRMTRHAPLYFETGLEYIAKGGKTGDYIERNMDYLEVPLTLKYMFDTNSDITVQPFVGGYLAAGVGGKTKYLDEHAVRNTFDEGFKRFDGGLKLGCGVSYSMLYADLSYDIGLKNIFKDDFDEVKTGSLQLTVGVNF